MQFSMCGNVENETIYFTPLFHLNLLGVKEVRLAGPFCSVSSASDSRAGFDTWSDHILLFHLQLIQEEQLSVTGDSICTKYWLTAACQGKVWLG